MKNKIRILTIIIIIFSILLGGCDRISDIIGGNTVEIEIVYGSEKQEWLEQLIKTYNAENHKTSDGSVIKVTGIPMGSIESVEAIIQGAIRPVVWSPASSVYIPVANAEWKKNHSENLFTETPRDLVLSPVIIAMWQPMAEVLGWPDKALGWADIANMATSADGWAELGYPEWGSFKFGHTHPRYSNSGLVSVIAQAYAGSGKQRDLTLDDLSKKELKEFVSDVQTSIIHYGTSTGFFGTRMFQGGPSYLSAAVLYENLVVSQEVKRLNGNSTQLPVVAIYPKEGTFWSNHPYVILNTEWVTDIQKEAAKDFQNFLLAEPQQLKAIEFGFRPADPSIPLASPLDARHGIDSQQPKTVLEIPSANVINGVISLWKETKKPVDLVLAIDTSGSMAGDKISSARNSLMQFITLLDDRDRLQITIFNTDAHILTPLLEVGPNRESLIRRVGGLVEGGDTSLFDAASESVSQLEIEGNPKHIRAVVLLSDGQDTASLLTFDEMMAKIGPQTIEGGNSIKLFTIAFGGDADTDVLKRMAEITGGKAYSSDPGTINKVYSDIATFF